ncbi:helix-turn-helix domain-containing protein [Macrococcus equi]|uniref:helix-turn-helix domain-containing protein n=1 Tax=Macrococcus equi TaxID=3395462 RepID=UPI0039BE097B
MINENARKLGEFIKELRKEKKVSGKELASYVGYSQSYLSAIENNNNNNVPNKKVLSKIAEALSQIGYEFNDIENQLFIIAGYPPIKSDTLNLGYSMAHDYNKKLGYFDNLSNEMLSKPYLDLNYLLTNDFELKFTMDHNGKKYRISLNEKQKSFINNLIKEMLVLSDVQNEINSIESKQKKIDEFKPLQFNIGVKIEALKNDLKILYELQKDFNKDHFRKILNENIKSIETNHINSYSLNDLENVISLITKEIEKLNKETLEIDNKIDN